MSIDTAAILAARYHSDPAPLKAAVLGQGSANINPYAALRALQLQKEAERYKMAEAAMNGQQQQPSLVQQALQNAQMPQQQQPQQQQQQPQQGLMAMNQQQQQPSPGLAGMPMPEGNEEEYAGGGILAFAGEDESLVKNKEDQLDPGLLEGLEDSELDNSMGDETSYKSVSEMLPGLMRNIQNTRYIPMSDAGYKTAFTERRNLLQNEAGTDPIPGMQQQIEQFDAERQQGLSQAKGLAMLAAAGDVLEPGGLLRGLGKAGKTFATEYGKAEAASKAEQRSLMSMKFNLADAQRKEKMGLNREAIHAADQARADHTASQRFKLDKNKALATVATGMARATRPGANTGAPKGYDNLVSGLYGELKYKNDSLKKQNPNDPNIKDESVLLADAHRAAAPIWAKIPAGETLDIKKTETGIKERAVKADETRAVTDKQREENERRRIATEQGKTINEAITKWDRSREAIEAKRDGTYETARKKKIDSLRSQLPTVPTPSSEPAYPDQSTAPASAPASAGNKNSQAKPAGGKVLPKVVTKADVAATAKASGKTVKEVEAALKAKGITIK
jgi:hypothetical protein